MAWLDYGRHDAASRRLLEAARQHGAAAAWQAATPALTPEELTWVARGLAASGMETDARWL